MLIVLFLFQSQRTLFRPFDRALVEMVPDISKYEWLIKLPNEFVDKSTEIPSETLENLKVCFSYYHQ